MTAAPAAMAGEWIATGTGAAFSLTEPVPDAVDFRSGALALAKIARFCGQTTTFYSVAQHSVLVADIAGRLGRGLSCDETRRRLKLAALLHDFHEAYLGDIPSPVKRLLRRETDAIDRMACAIDKAVYVAAGLVWPLPKDLSAMVHQADLFALAAEKRDLMADGPEWTQRLPTPATVPPITALPWDRAADAFIAAFERLMQGRL